MVDSANSLRRQRRALTARALTTPARLWTADRGIGGFTIDELCEAAGVSRRTFFNYFASKEDAVLGVCVERGDDHLAAAFIAGGAGRAGRAPEAGRSGGTSSNDDAGSTPVERTEAGLTVTLLDDLIELFRARWELIGITLEDAKSLFAAVDREPRLHRRMLEHLRESETADIALIAEREGIAPDDPRASTIVHIVGTMNRLAVEEYFTAQELRGGAEPPATASPGADAPRGAGKMRSYPEILRARVEVARAVMR